MIQTTKKQRLIKINGVTRTLKKQQYVNEYKQTGRYKEEYVYAVILFLLNVLEYDCVSLKYLYKHVKHHTKINL